MTRAKEPTLIYFIEAVFLVLLIFIVGSIAYYFITKPETIASRQPVVFPDFIEAQELAVIRKSDAVRIDIQNTEHFENGVWSSDDHLFVHNVSANDSLSLSLPVSEESNYQIVIHLSRSYDYGEWTIKVNDVPVKKVDLFSRLVEPAEPVDLGTHRLAPSKSTLRFEVVGHNAQAKPPYYQLGIDGVAIKRVNETP